MIKRVYSLLLIASVLYIPSVNAITDDQSQSILRLGELNGVALHCKQLKQVRVIKLSLVQSLPKLRRLGDMFEAETNRSFLDFIKSGKPCPTEATLADQVQGEITLMRELFKKPK